MSRPPASAAEARGLVDLIIRRNGFVRERSLETMSQEVRREVEEALLAKDVRIGSSVLTLAKNLYTSKARFVFELLQNTDDNNYHLAQAAGQDPFVSFALYPDKLVVDCNEDGFTEENLSAICDIGNSSKSSSQGYIGEKGIGFKSVFMAAWMVHIQSGHLSFSFVHRKGDSGMGMVKPMWEDPAGALPQVNYTRITLFLHEDRDPEQMEREREDIRDQFRELEPALLLFVRKLRCVEVTFCNEHGQQTWATRLTRRQAAEANRAVLERRTTDGGSVRDAAPESHIYHVTEHTATNVARHDNRELSALHDSSPASRQSKILLAFPVSARSVPVIEAQKVFAFLPMKQMGFNFIIQADFVTQANREDIVTISARNKDLRKGIVDAFVKTILHFCSHETLQYTWMRYLPQEGTHHWEPFWKKLVEGIKTCIQEEKVVRTRRKHVLRRITDMKDLTPDTYDRQGQPLFPDLDPEVYLSDAYERRDVAILQTLGLKKLDMRSKIETVWQDLKGFGSKMRSPLTDGDWHARAASMLLQAWDSTSPAASERTVEISRLPIIPLEDGLWVSAEDGNIFYGTIGNISIPKDLGLRIASSRPAKDPKRRALFDKLGVQSAKTTMIRYRIIEMYDEGDMSDVSLENSLEHLKFL